MELGNTPLAILFYSKELLNWVVRVFCVILGAQHTRFWNPCERLIVHTEFMENINHLSWRSNSSQQI